MIPRRLLLHQCFACQDCCIIDRSSSKFHSVEFCAIISSNRRSGLYLAVAIDALLKASARTRARLLYRLIYGEDPIVTMRFSSEDSSGAGKEESSWDQIVTYAQARLITFTLFLCDLKNPCCLTMVGVGVGDNDQNGDNKANGDNDLVER